MVRIIFGQEVEAQDNTPLPEGEYRCRLTELNATITTEGLELWESKYEVLRGAYKGKTIIAERFFIKDNLRRVKCFCELLGIDISDEIGVVLERIVNHNIFVDIDSLEYEDEYGDIKMRNTARCVGMHTF